MSRARGERSVGDESGSTLEAPFPWFGGKRRVAAEVWRRFGAVKNYVEPFFGSGAVLLGRPVPFEGLETINDRDAFVANFWRAVKHAPGEVAEHASNPVNENDLTARHLWLVEQKAKLWRRVEGDHEYFDAKIAGYWVWGISCWIGGGFCDGGGPWAANANRELVNRQRPHLRGDKGVNRKLPHLRGDKGVNRKLPHLSGDMGVNRQRPHLSGDMGVNRQLPHLGGDKGVNEWMEALSARLRRVRVCSGDWSRVTGPSVVGGLVGIFLDPPYALEAGRSDGLYATENLDVAHRVRRWAIEVGARGDARVALCGYEGEHEMPSDWAVYEWKAQGGYGARNANNVNAARERVWFSPACLK